jgi:hypothetical protein
MRAKASFFTAFGLIGCLLGGCAEEFIVYHSQTGAPLIISRRAFSPEGCVDEVKADAARLEVSFRHVHVRGSTVGRSLLWPFEPGYACEAAIGPEELPSGAYLIQTFHIPSTPATMTGSFNAVGPFERNQ